MASDFYVRYDFNKFRTLDDGLSEAISTILWAAPRIQTDVQEMKVISDILTSKYGRPYTDACREEALQTISEKLKHKMSVQSPSKVLVEKYLMEIAKNYNVEYEPDPQIMAEGQDTLLIDIGNGGQVPNNLDQASGGAPQPVGFIGYPQIPLPPNSASGGSNLPIGFAVPSSSSSGEKTENNQFNAAAFSYNIPLDKGDTNQPVCRKSKRNMYVYSFQSIELIYNYLQAEDLPPPYGSFPPDLNKQVNK